MEKWLIPRQAGNTYDEFEAYEVKHTKDNAENESEADADIEAAKASLKTIFNHLNVDTESSKDDLDKEEIMNYFFSMDLLDSEKYTADGYVSQNSYIKMQNALADDENVEQKDKDGNTFNPNTFSIADINNPTQEEVDDFAQLTPARKIAFVTKTFKNAGPSVYIAFSAFSYKSLKFIYPTVCATYGI